MKRSLGIILVVIAGLFSTSNSVRVTTSTEKQYRMDKIKSDVENSAVLASDPNNVVSTQGFRPDNYGSEGFANEHLPPDHNYDYEHTQQSSEEPDPYKFELPPKADEEIDIDFSAYKPFQPDPYTYKATNEQNNQRNTPNDKPSSSNNQQKTSSNNNNSNNGKKDQDQRTTSNPTPSNQESGRRNPTPTPAPASRTPTPSRSDSPQNPQSNPRRTDSQQPNQNSGSRDARASSNTPDANDDSDEDILKTIFDFLFD